MDEIDDIAASDHAGSRGTGRVRRSPEQWRELIAGQLGSGLGVGAFCQHHQITSSCFYRWRRFLAGEGQTHHPGGQGSSPWAGRKKHRQDAGLVEAKASPPLVKASPPPGFVRVAVADTSSNDGPIRLVLRGGRELILPASMPIDRLAELIMALEKTDFGKLSRPGASCGGST
jgi:transposase-like protein